MILLLYIDSIFDALSVFQIIIYISKEDSTMKDATLFVVQRPHQGHEVIENVLNYMVASPFADCDSLLTNQVCNYDLDQMVRDFYAVQEPYNMENHRILFHMVLSTRPSKVAQAVIDSGAEAVLDYFTMLGHQVVLICHDGSRNNYQNYHYHIAVNPISYLPDRRRLIDKYETYYNIVHYLNMNTCNNWSWGFTKPSTYQKYIC